MSPELILKLRKRYKNIKGCKDTVKNFEHTRKLCSLILPEFPDFEIYSGFDEFFVQNVLSGGCGCIGGLTNICPKLFSEWVKALNENQWTKVAEIQKKVSGLMAMFDISSPFLTGVKRAMKIRGIRSKEYGKAPLVTASEEEDKKSENFYRRLMFNMEE